VWAALLIVVLLTSMSYLCKNELPVFELVRHWTVVIASIARLALGMIASKDQQIL
jgi:hypothetical protein